MGCVVYLRSPIHLLAPSSDADYHIVSKYCQENQTSPNSMGLRRLITEFLWPPSSSIIRPLPYSIKVLVKTNQTSPNSMGLRRLITEFYGHLPAPSSDADYHIVSKYSSRGIKRAQTRWGCVV
ncbi:hypothetical protein EVAR_94027_1 [Eumeta japonica]|uniref:Uncharacterized protein n=1 Tax=Eumeta variegata TaxID=151549 RepID=A0A4C2AC67_EUMVA|nr:hypothetical protein EVAR_94027_1 [Eumeta japonica]